MRIYKKNRFDYFVVPYYRRIEFYILLNVLLLLFFLTMYKYIEFLSHYIFFVLIVLLSSLFLLISLFICNLINDIRKYKRWYIKSKKLEKTIRKALIDTMQLNVVKNVKRIEVPDVFVDLYFFKDSITVVIERLSGMDNIEKFIPLVSNSFKGKKYGNYAVVDFIENDNKLDFKFVLEDVKLDKTLIPTKVEDLLVNDLYKFKLQKDLIWDISKFPHLLCSGATGSGKTSFLISLALQSFAKDINMYLIDPKREFMALKNSFFESKEVLTLLNNLVNEMSQRELKVSSNTAELGRTSKDLGYKPVMIFIDELTALVASFDSAEKKEFEKLIRIIILKGRATGYNLLFFAQNFNSETISVAIRNQPSVRITLGQNSSEDYRFVFGSNTETISNGLIPRFTGYYLIRGINNTPQRFYVTNLHKYKLNRIKHLHHSFRSEQK